MKKININHIRSGFSLMEMMIVLLIVAIVAAASAPMISKRMTRNAGTGDSPWIFTGTSDNIAYNLRGNNVSAIIGGVVSPLINNNRARLHIQSDGTRPQISLSDGNGNNAIISLINNTINLADTIQLDRTRNRLCVGGAAMGDNNSVAIAGINNNTIPQNSIVIGNNSTTSVTWGAVIIGNNITGDKSVQIGPYGSGISIDHSAQGNEVDIAGSSIGNLRLSIGARAASAFSAINIGETFKYSGNEDGKRTITLGHSGNAWLHKDVVYIPGDLVVDGNVFLGAGGGNTVIKIDNSGSNIIYRPAYQTDGWTDNMNVGGSFAGWVNMFNKNGYAISDRRLKNVGEKFTAGLDELKKLEFFNYTLKSDEKKTPRVGVMAQDLQKVFPNAVFEGPKPEKYLSIRWDDMFYAVINAVKELDTKITEIVKNIQEHSDKIAQLEAKINSQQETIDALQAQNKAFEKQNAEFEKRLKRLERKREFQAE